MAIMKTFKFQVGENYHIYSNKHPGRSLEYQARYKGMGTYYHSFLMSLIVYHYSGFCVQIRGVVLFWNMGIY